MGLFLSYLSATLYQKSSHHTLLLWLFSHTLKLPLLLRFLSLWWITTALLLLYSQIQHPPGPNRRKILKHTSQGTSPGRTAWLITVIRLMGKDYLIETTGHLSHPTHFPSPGLLFRCPTEPVPCTCVCKCSCSCSLGRGDSRVPESLAAASQAVELSQPQVCHLNQHLPWGSREAPAGNSAMLPRAIKHICCFCHTLPWTFPVGSFSYFCLSPALQKAFSI